MRWLRPPVEYGSRHGGREDGEAYLGDHLSLALVSLAFSALLKKPRPLALCPLGLHAIERVSEYSLSHGRVMLPLPLPHGQPLKEMAESGAGCLPRHGSTRVEMDRVSTTVRMHT